MALAELPFPNVLRAVTLQFSAFLSNAENTQLLLEDQSELANIFSMVANLDGDFNHHLKYHPQMLIYVSWYYNKYNGQLMDLSRKSTTQFNLVYVRKRENGYGEWDAKRQAETNSEWLDMVYTQDRLQKLVNILKSLVDACKERLPVLQQLSNNYRAEVRGEASMI